jgi:RimJ/RimL family protein N-acetyltransferase
MTPLPWPLFDLVVRTPRLELRYPDDDLLGELLDVARSGVHPDDVMPFTTPWTRQPPGVLDREFLKFHWSTRARTSRDHWTLTFVVLLDGDVVGSQDLSARGFGVRRTCETGSWLGLAHQGQGIGSEMRAAVLELAFGHLGAELCVSSAWHDNAASIAVSRRLGYADDGWELGDREGTRTKQLRFRIARADWRSPVPVDVDGLEPCLPLLVGHP